MLTAGGYREPITLQQIRINMEMESHEEKLHNMIKISKIESAKDQAMAAAKAIKDKQKEQQRLGLAAGNSGMGSMGNASLESMLIESQHAPVATAFDNAPSPPPPVSSTRRAAPVKGMSLSGGGKNKSVEDALMREDKLAPLASSAPKAPGAVETPAAAPMVVQHPVTLTVVEKVSATMTRDGMVEMFEIKGSLTLTAADDEAALCSVQLKLPASLGAAFAFNTHPKVNKALYEKSGLLQLKDPTKGFPSARPVGILKWTHSSNSDELVPLKINCWPEEESRGQMNVSIEYSMDVPQMELHDVVIRIPLGTTAAPNILSVDGAHKHNCSTGELIWEVNLIDSSNSSGSLEFNIAQRDTDAFFPISVGFSAQKLYCDLEVVSVNAVQGGTPMVYGSSRGMSTDEYIIQ